MMEKTIRSLTECMLSVSGVDDPEKLSITYVVKEGGFVNQSFRVRIDGAADSLGAATISVYRLVLFQCNDGIHLARPSGHRSLGHG